jgi:AcrR family transcriptional regulator
MVSKEESRSRPQHEREESILRAVAEIAHEVGPQNLTVALVIDRAGTSRAAFYKLHANGSDALGKALELAHERLEEAISAGCDQAGAWADRVESTISALLNAVDDEPAFAALCLLHSHSISGTHSSFHPVLVKPLMHTLRGGRTEIGDVGQPPRTEEFVACGILSVVAERLRSRGEVGSREGLAAELTDLVIRCYPPP